MPLSDYLIASGQRVHGGETGQLYHHEGEIRVSTAARVGADSNLWAVLKIAVDALKLKLNILSIDTGAHVAGSRHYDGRAVDISQIGPVGAIWSACTPANSYAVQLVNYLLAHGFKAGEGPHNPGPALLFGPPRTSLNPSDVAHRHHLHVSLGKAAGDTENSFSGEPIDSAPE
jgi:hypothetical protein